LDLPEGERAALQGSTIVKNPFNFTVVDGSASPLEDINLHMAADVVWPGYFLPAAAQS
jgi:hypothetical protein